MSDFETRFGGVARLFSQASLERLRRAHVAVVGIGGVGSWAVEALARTGVGRLTLIDLDEVCVSNVNRQLHALDGTVGQMKGEVMAARVRTINPDCQVNAVLEFFTESNAEQLLSAGFDYAVDAIDGVTNKCRLIAACHSRKIPIVSCGAAGGRTDTTAVRVADLARVTDDRLLFEVRRKLRKYHEFPRGGKKFGVECVYSPEPPIYPRKDGTVCGKSEVAPREDLKLNCDWGFGSAVFVTGAFGFTAAGVVVKRIAAGA